MEKFPNDKDIEKTEEETEVIADESTLSDKEIYEMERNAEKILADMSMTTEREGSEMRETATKNRLIEELKGKGMDDPETRTFFNSWIRDQEAHAGAMDTPAVDIASLRERAEVLRASDLLQEALYELENARIQAWNEGMDELCTDIEEEMYKIEDEMGGADAKPKE